MSQPIGKLVVIGVGLIGGSFALALRERGAVRRVVGIGRSQANLQEALKRGVIDEAVPDYEAALKGADFVLLAMPVGQTKQVLEHMAPYLEAKIVVTDAGSTKQDVIEYARGALGRALLRFVPGHPIAGAEASGASAARADLYQGKTVVLTPLTETDRQALETVRSAWSATGARVSEMPAAEHDRLLAAVSHFPHVLAYALMCEIAGREDCAMLLQLAGSGFRDLTRIAGSSPEMWRDIVFSNRAAVLAELAAFEARLEEVRALVQAGDGAALARMFGRAREARRLFGTCK
jgi:prephenate dehydrogenase